jgi:phosphoribosylaminoimidazolecarboxamide formyltransferase/IMP cyclohydrolase
VVLHELRADGALGPATRRRLARRAFALTAAYDAAIVSWLDASDDDAGLPPSLHLALERVQPLRYGENPHQRGARYRDISGQSWWDAAIQHGGKELSYLNVLDAEAAWRLVHRFERPAVVIVKHANPCGVAVADDVALAYERAHAADPVSAFGGIVAANRTVPGGLAEALAPVFTEVVIAPGFDDDALVTLTKKANLRVLSAPAPQAAELDVRTIDGGLLVQEADPVSTDRSDWRVVTRAEPTDAQWADLVFGWQVCDAFFPVRDGLDALAAAGVRAVIQPGGSVRDDEVITAADDNGLVMVFTGQRHFRH